MAQAGHEALGPSQEPVVKMAREVRVEEIQKILGQGETDWFRRELFLLDYPQIGIRLSFEVQDKGPLRLRGVSIGGNKLMEVSDTIAAVLNMDDGSVKLVEPAREKNYMVTG